VRLRHPERARRENETMWRVQDYQDQRGREEGGLEPARSGPRGQPRPGRDLQERGSQGPRLQLDHNSWRPHQLAEERTVRRFSSSKTLRPPFGVAVVRLSGSLSDSPPRAVPSKGWALASLIHRAIFYWSKGNTFRTKYARFCTSPTKTMCKSLTINNDESDLNVQARR